MRFDYGPRGADGNNLQDFYGRKHFYGLNCQVGIATKGIKNIFRSTPYGPFVSF